MKKHKKNPIELPIIFAIYFSMICDSILLNLINLNRSDSNLYLIGSINLVAFICLFFSIPELFNSRNRFLYLIQTLFNKKWFKKFPKLYNFWRCANRW